MAFDPKTAGRKPWLGGSLWIEVSIACLLCLTTVVPGAAQQSRADEIAAKQAEKATNLKPYEPTRLERRIESAERSLLNPPPFYPFIGSVLPGGLIAVGPGYRHRLPGEMRFDTHAAWSLRNYKLAEATLDVPLGTRVSVKGETRWLDAPSVAFFGVGGDSRTDDRTPFAYSSSTAGATLRFAPLPAAAVGGRLHYLKVKTDGNNLTSRPGLEPIGVAADPEYTVSGAFGEIDWRDGPGYSRNGGLYRVEWTRYDQRDLGAYSFERIDGDVNQFIPLLRGNWVVAMRALMSVTQADSGNAVPFFLLPDLGGSRELRGYSALRFRGNHRILLTGEYRWAAGQFVDMALFLDAGKVTQRRSSLNLENLKTSYGLGVRFHTPISTPLRVELARTGDGLALVFGFGPSF